MIETEIENRSGLYDDLTRTLLEGRGLGPSEQTLAFQSDLSPHPLVDPGRTSSEKRYGLFSVNRHPRSGSYLYGLYFLPQNAHRDAIIYLRTRPNTKERRHDLIARTAMDLEANKRGAKPLRIGELSVNGDVVRESLRESFLPASDEALRQVLQTHFLRFKFALDSNP
jgi:hypothetical protein